MRPRRERRGEHLLNRDLFAIASGFNAATARAPWRTTRTAPRCRERLLASMRPRRERRGEHHPNSTSLNRRSLLQCGHGASAVENLQWSKAIRHTPCFNAATARAPWRTTRGPNFSTASRQTLQCGHGASAVENGAGEGGTVLGRKGFKAATARAPWRTVVIMSGSSVLRGASMRPRRERRGERRGAAAVAGAPGTLQCGHGASAVENRAAAAAPPGLSALQCGHGASAVENCR